MWATRPALTAAMGRTYREKYPLSSDADFFPTILVRCGYKNDSAYPVHSCA